jgi:hypothetical protein
MKSLNNIARLAGVLYLVITICAPFSMIYVPSILIVQGDAATTANNIMASVELYRAGIAVDSVVFLTEIVLTILLYVLLKPVSNTLSMVAASFRLAMTIVQGINLLNHFFVLMLLSGDNYLSAFQPDQLHALIMLFLNAHEYAALIWGLFFGFHLFMLGYLVYKSGYLSRIVGVLLVVASLCYLTQGFGNILLPKYKEIFAMISFLAFVELAFPLWLLIKGVKEQHAQAV